MTNKELISIFNLLSSIKLNKVSDKETRSAILANHMALYKLNKGVNDDVEELRKRFFEGKEAELKKYIALQDAGKTDELDPKMRELVIEFNTEYGNLMSSHADVSLKKIDADSFVDALAEQNIDITLEELARMQECGLVG